MANLKAVVAGGVNCYFERGKRRPPFGEKNESRVTGSRERRKAFYF